jgi:hypothetical protein
MTDANQEAIQSQENVSSDISAFCVLIARIMMRCLRERDPHIMELLSLPFQTEEAETEGTHDAA